MTTKKPKKLAQPSKPKSMTNAEKRTEILRMLSIIKSGTVPADPWNPETTVDT